MSGIKCVGCSAAREGVVAPLLPDAIPPLPGETAWVLPVDFQGQPLRVEIPEAWPNYENTVGGYIDLEFYWDEELVATHQLVEPFDAARDFPVAVAIPVHHFNTPGIRVLEYVVMLENGNSVKSPEIQVEIDHRAPNGNNPGAPLIFQDEVVSDGVTQAWLVANGDRLTAEVPRWPDIELGDVVHFYWGAPVEAAPVGSLTITETHLQPGTLIEIAYSGDTLRLKGNGTQHGYYVLADRAGNRNDPSYPVPIVVHDLPAVPGDFPAPLVPLATQDRLIDLEDVRQGVVVEIGPIEDTQAGDTLQAWWNGRALPLVTLGATPNWPERIAVSWDILSADGFAAAVPCDVLYRWQRGTAPGVDSRVTTFTVDLRVAGPDPIGPDPINPGLELLVVKGLTGDNVLVVDDHGKPARVELDLYANPVADDLLELHWGDHPQVADSYRVQTGDQPDQRLAFTVPWPIIEAVGNSPALPVWYWVSNGINRQRSPDTLVRVAVRPVEGLEQVSFPDASIYGWIACVNEPWKGIRVQIPGNPQLLAAGDSIELSWQLSRGTVGEDPITEPVLFPPRTLTAAEAENGVILLMERFTELVLPLQAEDGSANVTYHLTKADGTPGFAPNKLLRISLGRPDGTVCDGTR